MTARRAAPLALLLAAAPAAARAGEPRGLAELAGWWSAEGERAGERAEVLLHLASEGGQDVARLSLPAIGGWDIPVGPAALEGGRLRVGRSFVLAVEEGGAVLRGVLPEALVPAYRVEVAFRRAAPPAFPEPEAWAAPRPEVLWSNDLGAPVWAGLARDPATGALFAATDAGAIVALDGATGRALWRASAGGPVRARPTLAGAHLYVASDDGRLHKLDARSGRVVWRAAIDAGGPPRRAPGAPGSRLDRYASSAVVEGGRAYVGSRDGSLYALDAATGQVAWRARAGDLVLGAPAVAGDAVVFGSYDGHVRAVAARDGSLRWDRDTRGPVVSDVAVAAGRAIVGNRAYDLDALDLATGELAWQRYSWFSWVESPAAIRDGVAYVGSSDARRVRAFDAATGRRVWERDVPGYAWAEPAVGERAVYAAMVGSRTDVPGARVLPRRGALVALDRATGAVLWIHLAEAPAQGDYGFAAAPVCAGDRVFAADLAGRVRAFSAAARRG